MDDLTTLRDAWDRPAPPSAAAHAAARAALLERASARTAGTAPRRARRFRLPRMGLRLAAVGALAVTIAAGVTVAQNLGGTDKNGHPRPVVPGLPAGAVANAQTVLAQAAEHAQARPHKPPRADQWVYTETRYTSPGNPPIGKVQTSKTPLKTRIDRTWYRADGKRLASYDHGKLEISPTGGGVPPIGYTSLSTLPRDPDALLAWFRRQGAPGDTADERDGHIFDLLGSLLDNNGVVPPQQEATVYRAMAKISGVTLNKEALDVDGRPALAVSRVNEGWLRSEILFDRKTYAFLGERSVAVKDHTGDAGTGKSGSWTVKKGTIDVLFVRLAAGVVDKPGQRP
ncbi:CU044_5270 family protein [Actinoallomurus purpureus]|uniref:CU044_5270 family protein n=1 Tax=Actinoallomurus purpureus TaxID=478114 RepID=UPI002092FC69|nr:CU044_5270 family protein [Actinoallomurus purpureus]MCO6006647.1 CU044_5270 family protein [Actinoallomurus purpureus]